jgi:ABC-type multidrug transport system ATPase subunit
VTPAEKDGGARIYGHPLAVRARGITKCFGDVVALDGIDLDVPAGRIHGVIGPNGAGKTTMLGLSMSYSRDWHQTR